MKPSWKTKIKSLKSLAAAVHKLQQAGKKVVFTNGCFDILHLGHIDYLERAKALGDCLVVAINTDSSVKRLKGPKRPVNPEQDRAGVLAGLAAVDFVVLFDEDTPLEVIKALKPNILVKGGDWAVAKIVGADFVTSLGGRVHSLDFLEGRSTTKVLERIEQFR